MMKIEKKLFKRQKAWKGWTIIYNIIQISFDFFIVFSPLTNITSSCGYLNEMKRARMNWKIAIIFYRDIRNYEIIVTKYD